MPRKFPDRWLDYTKFGDKVEGTSFIPLKVPLKKEFFEDRAIDSFTPDDAVQEIPNLGLIIDLTFTAKYYNPTDFECQDIMHKKIYTKGHEIPGRYQINQFIHIVDDFLANDKNKDKIIGVHCTHGLNRTGYFICAYMILALGQSPRTAIHLFNKARSHKMERANYLNSLLHFVPFSCSNGYNKYEESVRQDFYDDKSFSGRRETQRKNRSDRPNYRYRSRSPRYYQQSEQDNNSRRSYRNWKSVESRYYDRTNRDEVSSRANNWKVDCFDYLDSRSNNCDLPSTSNSTSYRNNERS
ncbi:RNA/RNP complex-1-interacting phosphatase [Malaya genurostris]|uniref:RNA/RNP complex-1-interacting phosphatase n=1 Tax=Malaya genurostris TaxID=325434 RepID=UPI0026F39B48|nr:RNA/RNP complex-1-interacting phosphatase [Malaya genurostris]